MSETAPKNYEGKHAAIRRKKVWSPLARVALAKFNGQMGKMMTEVRDPYDEKVVLASREGRELIKNDGKATYIVHSTTPEQAREIIERGLQFSGKHGQPEVPDLRETGVMLASSGERVATQRNIHNLAYRYGDKRSSIKLVYEFDEPNPRTSSKDDPFQATFLAQADGLNIRSISSEGDGSYLIPPERLKGYFDLDNGQFVPNPQFVTVAGEL